MLDLRLARKNCYRQRAFDWTHSSVKRQLANTKKIYEVVLFSEIAVCAEDAKRDGEIETGALLSHISGRQVDRDSLKWKEEPAVGNGGANALARLTHRGIRQSHNCYGQGRLGLAPHGRQINFNIDEVGVDAVNRR